MCIKRPRRKAVSKTPLCNKSIPLPVILCSVLEELCELQGVFANLLHWRQKETVDGNINHLLQQTTRFEEILVPAVFHQLGKLHACIQMVVTVLRVDPEAILL